MKLFILAALLATASASVTSAEVRLNDNTGASVAAIRYNSVDRLVVADLTVPGQAQANTAEVSDFLAKFHAEFDQLKKEMEMIKNVVAHAGGKIMDNAGDIDTLENRANTLKGRADTLRDRADNLQDNLQKAKTTASNAVDAIDKRIDNVMQQIVQEAKDRHSDTVRQAVLFTEQKGAELLESLKLQRQDLIDNELQAVADAALEAKEAADSKVTLALVEQRLDTLKQQLVDKDIAAVEAKADEAREIAEAKITLAEAQVEVGKAIDALETKVDQAQSDAVKAQTTADTRATVQAVEKKIQDATTALVNTHIKNALAQATVAKTTADSKTTMELVEKKITEVVDNLKSKEITAAQNTAGDALKAAKERATLQDVQSAVNGAVKTLADGAVSTAKTTADAALKAANKAQGTADAKTTMAAVLAALVDATGQLKGVKGAQDTADKALDLANQQLTLKEVQDVVTKATSTLSTVTTTAGDALALAKTNSGLLIKKTEITLTQVKDVVSKAKADLIEDEIKPVKLTADAALKLKDDIIKLQGAKADLTKVEELIKGRATADDIAAAIKKLEITDISGLDSKITALTSGGGATEAKVKALAKWMEDINPCGPGELVDVQSFTCKDCPKDHYCPTTKHNVPIKHKTCNNDQYVLVPGTRSADTQCEQCRACPSGWWKQDAGAACSATGSYSCVTGACKDVQVCDSWYWWYCWMETRCGTQYGTQQKNS